MFGAVVLVAAVALQSTAPLALRVRVFDGTTDVTAESRVKIFKAGDRQNPVGELGGTAADAIPVTAGLYDAQAIRERDGRVVSIRWAERLVVMPYVDEGGQHLEVVNFRQGFGALEVRAREGAIPDVAIFTAGNHQQEAGRRLDLGSYALFVVPAGRYDLAVRRGAQTTWHPDIEVPRDHTRLWLVPERDANITRGVPSAAGGR